MRPGRRRLILAGLLSAAAFVLSAGPARADVPAPSPAQWWFSGWQVQQKVWPLAQGDGVTVAVIDTGVQASLPDLRGVVRPGGDLTGAGGDGQTDGDAAGDGHGTAIAVLIAGQGYGTGVVGIAPRARILPVKVGDEGARSPAVAAAAIRFAVRHDAQVINLSLGAAVTSPTACDPDLQAAIGYALEHNVVVVAAAGNRNVMPGPMEPGSCAGVLTVGAVGPDGVLWPGSTREPYVAVAAPGDRITFVGRDGRHSAAAAGTSFSAALISGAAALIRSRYPGMPWYEVDQRLTNTARPAGSPVPNDAYGYGVVDLARAVNASAYPLSASAPNPVYARFRAWLTTLDGQVITAQHASPVAIPAGVSATSSTQPGVTLREVVVVAVAAVCVFTGVLVGVLRLSARRRVAAATPPRAPVPGDWERRTWSFGPREEGGDPGAPGYGRQPGYGPPPLWDEPPGWR